MLKNKSKLEYSDLFSVVEYTNQNLSPISALNCFCHVKNTEHVRNFFCHVSNERKLKFLKQSLVFYGSTFAEKKINIIIKLVFLTAFEPNGGCLLNKLSFYYFFN